MKEERIKLFYAIFYHLADGSRQLLCIVKADTGKRAREITAERCNIPEEGLEAMRVALLRERSAA